MNKEKLKEIYFKFSIVIEFILSFIVAVCIYKIEYKFEDFSYISAPNLAIALICGAILLASIIINIIKNKEKLEKIFIHVVVLVGMLYMVFMIPCYAPDEEGHIFKSYDISLGHLVTNIENDGDIYVPKQMLDMYKENINTYSKVHQFLQRDDIDYNNTVAVQTAAKSNSPLGYPVSASVYFIGRILNLNILLVTYMAKMANFILYMIIGYYIIKHAGFGKIIFFAYLLLPMFIHQATAITADTISNLSILFFISYTLKLLKQKENITLKQRLLYYFISAIIPLGKVAYFPLVAIGYILIANKNIKKKEKIKLLVISTLIAAIIGLSWYAWTKNYQDKREYYKEAGVNPTEQVQLMKDNPIGYVKVLLNNIDIHGGYYLVTCVGKDLGRLNINVPELVIYIFMLLLFATPFLEKNEITLNKWQKIWFLLIFLGMSVIVVTALYIGWSPVGYSFIAGVQGRYFIPILILILLTLCFKNKYIEFKNINIIYAILFMVLNIFPVISIVKFF